MKNQLLKELKELDLTMARLGDRRVEVINMLGTLATLITLEPKVGEQIDHVLTDGRWRKSTRLRASGSFSPV
jgi:hypothetical protein